MTVLITLTIAGADTGPFDLYSNIDGYSVPFEVGVSKMALESGYLSTLVPNGSTQIQVKSTGECTNSVFLPINGAVTTTTTSSTSSTSTSTTTTTTTTLSGVTLTYRYLGGNNSEVPSQNGEFIFELSGPLSEDITITGGAVSAYDENCTAVIETPLQGVDATLIAGNTSVSAGSSSTICSPLYARTNFITVNGTPLSNGDTIFIGGVTVTVSINTNCVLMPCYA